MTTALSIFAKTPVPGFAKTRLISALGAEGAAALAEKLLAHTVAQALATDFEYIELCITPDANYVRFDRLIAEGAGRLCRSGQGEGDLGARMNRALTRALTQHSGALLIGTDAPALDCQMLQAAASALASNDAVFVPSVDGGYALVGLTRPAPALFANMNWSTSRVMIETRERARCEGLRWIELPPVADVDEPADLGHLPEGWL